MTANLSDFKFFVNCNVRFTFDLNVNASTLNAELIVGDRFCFCSRAWGICLVVFFPVSMSILRFHCRQRCMVPERPLFLLDFSRIRSCYSGWFRSMGMALLSFSRFVVVYYNISYVFAYLASLVEFTSTCYNFVLAMFNRHLHLRRPFPSLVEKAFIEFV